MTYRETDIIISHADVSNASEILSLIRQLAREYNDVCTLSNEYILEYLDSAGCNVLVAKSGDLTVGALCYSIHPCLFHAAPSCTIEDLIIEREFRHMGIGRKLVKKVMDIAQREKCAEISVSTDMKNTQAIQLYKGCGLIEEYVLLEKHFE